MNTGENETMIQLSRALQKHPRSGAHWLGAAAAYVGAHTLLQAYIRVPMARLAVGHALDVAVQLCYPYMQYVQTGTWWVLFTWMSQSRPRWYEQRIGDQAVEAVAALDVAPATMTSISVMHSILIGLLMAICYVKSIHYLNRTLIRYSELMVALDPRGSHPMSYPRLSVTVAALIVFITDAFLIFGTMTVSFKQIWHLFCINVSSLIAMLPMFIRLTIFAAELLSGCRNHMWNLISHFLRSVGIPLAIMVLATTLYPLDQAQVQTKMSQKLASMLHVDFGYFSEKNESMQFSMFTQITLATAIFAKSSVFIDVMGTYQLLYVMHFVVSMTETGATDGGISLSFTLRNLACSFLTLVGRVCASEGWSVRSIPKLTSKKCFKRTIDCANEMEGQSVDYIVLTECNAIRGALLAAGRAVADGGDHEQLSLLLLEHLKNTFPASCGMLMLCPRCEGSTSPSYLSSHLLTDTPTIISGRETDKSTTVRAQAVSCSDVTYDMISTGFGEISHPQVRALIRELEGVGYSLGSTSHTDYIGRGDMHSYEQADLQNTAQQYNGHTYHILISPTTAERAAIDLSGDLRLSSNDLMELGRALIIAAFCGEKDNLLWHDGSQVTNIISDNFRACIGSLAPDTPISSFVTAVTPDLDPANEQSRLYTLGTPFDFCLSAMEDTCRRETQQTERVSAVRRTSTLFVQRSLQEAKAVDDVLSLGHKRVLSIYKNFVSSSPEFCEDKTGALAFDADFNTCISDVTSVQAAFELYNPARRQIRLRERIEKRLIRAHTPLTPFEQLLAFVQMGFETFDKVYTKVRRYFSQHAMMLGGIITDSISIVSGEAIEAVHQFKIPFKDLRMLGSRNIESDLHVDSMGSEMPVSWSAFETFGHLGVLVFGTTPMEANGSVMLGIGFSPAAVSAVVSNVIARKHAIFYRRLRQVLEISTFGISRLSIDYYSARQRHFERETARKMKLMSDRMIFSILHDVDSLISNASTSLVEMADSLAHNSDNSECVEEEEQHMTFNESEQQSVYTVDYYAYADSLLANSPLAPLFDKQISVAQTSAQKSRRLIDRIHTLTQLVVHPRTHEKVFADVQQIVALAAVRGNYEFLARNIVLCTDLVEKLPLGKCKVSNWMAALTVLLENAALASNPGSDVVCRVRRVPAPDTTQGFRILGDTTLLDVLFADQSPERLTELREMLTTAHVSNGMLHLSGVSDKYLKNKDVVWVEIQIKDEGNGISQLVLDSVFSLSSLHPGLLICALATVSSHGTFKINTEYLGTSVILTLPLEVVPEWAAHQSKKHAAPPLLALLTSSRCEGECFVRTHKIYGAEAVADTSYDDLMKKLDGRTPSMLILDPSVDCAGPLPAVPTFMISTRPKEGATELLAAAAKDQRCIARPLLPIVTLPYLTSVWPETAEEPVPVFTPIA